MGKGGCTQPLSSNLGLPAVLHRVGCFMWSPTESADETHRLILDAFLQAFFYHNFSPFFFV